MAKSKSNERSYSWSEIETIAARQLDEFRGRLTRNDFELPPMPPVPIEFIALTLTDFGVRAVPNLRLDERKLAGFLDPDNQEILYEENDPETRQNFSIAHEIGHYFLHYLPSKEQAALPSLFSPAELEAVSTGGKIRYFRCTETELDITSDNDEAEQGLDSTETAPTKTSPLQDPERHPKLGKMLRMYSQHRRRERQANAFASALLMPPELIRWLKTKHGGDVRRMAAELKVSQESLFYRLEYLKEASDITQPRFLNRKSPNPPPNQGTFF